MPPQHLCTVACDWKEACSHMKANCTSVYIQKPQSMFSALVFVVVGWLWWHKLLGACKYLSWSMRIWVFDDCEWHREREAFRKQLLWLSPVAETLTCHWRKCSLRETNEQLSKTAQVIYCSNLHFLLVTCVTLPWMYSWRVTFVYITFSVHWLAGCAKSIKSYNAPHTTPCESDDIVESHRPGICPLDFIVLTSGSFNFALCALE